MMFGLNQKIIKSEVTEDRLIIFEAKNMFIKIIDKQLKILSVINWRSMYPEQAMINKFENIVINVRLD